MTCSTLQTGISAAIARALPRVVWGHMARTTTALVLCLALGACSRAAEQIPPPPAAPTTIYPSEPPPVAVPSASLAAPSVYTLILTSSEPDQQPQNTQVDFSTKAKCDAARADALAEHRRLVLERQAEIDQLRTQNIIANPHQPPSVMAICAER